MARSMEAVAANMVLLVELVRHCIEVSVVRHGAVERIVEYYYLWCVRHQSVNSTQTTQVSCVMNRCKVDKTLDTFLHFLGYDAALLK